MDIKKIEKLIQLLKKHELHEIEVESEEGCVRLTAASAGFVPAMMPAPTFNASPSLTASGASIGHNDVIVAKNQVRSPFVGTFYESTSPGSEPFVKVGQRVRKGDTLCIIEAMKIMNEIEAERDGVVREVLVANAQAVEFDQALFTID